VLVYPVLRTKDLKPFVKYVGEVVQSTMKLDIASKELFTLDKMSAFKKSISSALGVDGINDDQIVIVRVCDASGCIDTTSTRRSTSGGISVVYEVQASGVPVSVLESALTADGFTNSFEGSMAANGYPVQAEMITATTTPAPPPPDSAGLGVSEKEEKVKTMVAQGLSTGAIVGIVIGCLVAVGAAVAIVFTQVSLSHIIKLC